jgi:hypothetical protein
MERTSQVFLFMIDKSAKRLINAGSALGASHSTVLPIRHAYPPGEYGKAAELCGDPPRHPLHPAPGALASVMRPLRAGSGPWLPW